MVATERAHDDLFVRVLVDGTPDAIAAWIAIGAEAVQQLHQHLSGERRVALPDGASERDYLDFLGEASHQVAAAYPDSFLAAFESPRWDEDPFICAGLGAIRRPEVTERLMKLLTADSHWLRVDAAVALRGHTHPDLRSVLEAAMQDPEYLVRYHVRERLDEMDDRPGDPSPHDGGT